MKSRKCRPICSFRLALEIGVRFQLTHAIAARHGDSFFWSFAQKMVPRPDGFEGMFFVRQEIHFSLANMVGRTARTLPLAAVSGGRAHRGWQA